ncbi:LOW QUALITY PROTEIN: hypothetical protein YC2023_078654 [Brassica napus]
MDFVPNKAYKIMGSAHLKGGSLANPRPLLSINKEPTSSNRALGLSFGNPSPGPAIINKHLFSYSLRVVPIRSKLSMKTSPNPTDESSSRSFTSLLTVLGSNSWRPPCGMEKYLRGRLNWSPFSRHLTDESSLDRRVVTRPFCRHSTVLSSLGTERSLAVARLDLRSRLARSLTVTRSFSLLGIDLSLRSLSPRGVDVSIQQQGLAEAYPYLTYPSWLHDESSRTQLARALAVTRLDLSRSLGADRSRAVTWLDLSRSLARSPYSVQNNLSQSLRSLSPRGVDVSFCRHPIDESSLDRRVLTRPTSRHSTVLSSLDRRVVARPTSRNSTVLSSLDRSVVTRPFCRHSTVLSSLDRRVLTRPTSPHSTDESSLDRRVITRPFYHHSTVLSSLGAERSLASICAVARLDLSRSLDSLPCGHSTCSSRSLDSLSRSHSAWIALSQSLRLLASLEHDVIPRRHVHP